MAYSDLIKRPQNNKSTCMLMVLWFHVRVLFKNKWKRPKNHAWFNFHILCRCYRVYSVIQKYSKQFIKIGWIRNELNLFFWVLRSKIITTMNPITSGLTQKFYHVLGPSKWLGKIFGWPGIFLELRMIFFWSVNVVFGKKNIHGFKRQNRRNYNWS